MPLNESKLAMKSFANISNSPAIVIRVIPLIWHKYKNNNVNLDYFWMLPSKKPTIIYSKINFICHFSKYNKKSFPYYLTTSKCKTNF